MNWSRIAGGIFMARIRSGGITYDLYVSGNRGGWEWIAGRQRAADVARPFEASGRASTKREAMTAAVVAYETLAGRR